MSVAKGLTARGAAFARPGGGPDAVWRSPDLAIGNTRGIGVVKRVLYDDVDVKPMQVKKDELAAPVVTPLGT